MYAIAYTATTDTDRKQEQSSTRYRYTTFPEEALQASESHQLLVGLLNIKGRSQFATDFKDVVYTSELTTKGLVDLINTRPKLSPAAVDSVEKFATAWAIFLKSQGLIITPYMEQINKRLRTGTNY